MVTSFGVFGPKEYLGEYIRPRLLRQHCCKDVIHRGASKAVHDLVVGPGSSGRIGRSAESDPPIQDERFHVVDAWNRDQTHTSFSAEPPKT